MFQVKTILNARDFSEPSVAAHQIACDVARHYDARLILLHVTDKPVFSYFEKASELPPDELQRKLFASLRLPAENEKGLDVEHRVMEGDPVQRILSVADEETCDLIVLGTHGKSGISRWFTTSVAEDVVRQAACSVLISKASPAESLATPPEPEHSNQQLN
jgi:nucleotide-binding universal stress UspA family protein